ncbi:hypothetical protein AAFF_G00276960 [Aldrovandia affinis]|uniref:Uncharacterized protein n=1 Tax=Aldrovandia affinis TaxID=143900 RepID=A0AAD7RAC5_9TELE|nr:hypothetical protein AAFF_G00276960 [Aldrovandia affinis]
MEGLSLQASTRESSAEEKFTPVVMTQQAAQLKQQLVSAHLDSLLGPQAHINLADSHGALAKRLLTQLEAVRESRGAPGGEGRAVGGKGTDGVVLYELHSWPEQNRFSESAKIVELEKRIAIWVEESSVLGKMNEIAKHKVATEHGNTQNKVQQTMKENLHAVEENFAVLDRRMKKLSK